MAKNTRVGPPIKFEVEQPVKAKELHEKQQRVCEVVAEILELEADKASHANEINQQLKPLRKERDTLLLATQQGIERIEVDAREHLFYDSRTVKVIQEGTKKVLHTREMTDDEFNNPELPSMEPDAEEEAAEEAAAQANGEARAAKKTAKKAASKTRRVQASTDGKPRQRRARTEQAEA